MTTFERTLAGLEALGFTMDKVEWESSLLMATLNTDCGKIEVMVGYPYYTNSKVTGVVNKPNNTVKWLYDKSAAQFCRAVEQVVEYYANKK